MSSFGRLEDLNVYNKLCDFHGEVCGGLEKTFEKHLPEHERRWPEP